MKSCRFTLALALALAGIADSFAAQSPKDAPAKQSQWEWNFNLMPTAFQKNPRLAMTVMTDMTPQGRLRRPVSPDAPAYYLAHAVGSRNFGEAVKQKEISPAEVEQVMQRALADSGFLPATSKNPPSLVVIYYWGTHNGIDSSVESASPTAFMANWYDRARLVGGEKFAEELRQAAEDAARQQETIGMAGGLGGGAAGAMAAMAAAFNPVKLLRNRSAKHEFLVDQTSLDCYYVVASAYDYDSVSTPNKQLLWRTRMTVHAQGISQLQAFPTLIASASPHFGREMSEPELVRRRVLREASVEVGTPMVVEDKPAPPAATK